MDVTANNLANVNTPGFKASRSNFQDLLYIEKEQPGSLNANQDQRPIGLYVGLGVKVSGTQLDFTQGPPQVTGRPLDVSINGEGFFRVQVEDSKGGEAFTRAGSFAVNKDGELVLATDQGRRIQPVIVVPTDATNLTISSDGIVSVQQPGAQQLSEIGRLETSTFINPSGLKQIGENLFVASDASGPPSTGNPGSDKRGTVKQGELESSNVDPTRELIDLIRTQRAYEMNSQSIKAADESMRTVTQLRR